MITHLQKLGALVLGFAMLGSTQVLGQATVNSLPYTQNFDGMTTSLPAGWTAVRFSGNGTAGEELIPKLSDGSDNSGAIYSAGALNSSDRALGTLASGSTVPRFGASFVNNTGAALTGVTLNAVSEQWRSGSASDINELVVFEYSLNATSISDAGATWVPVPKLNLIEILTASPSADGVDGNIHKAEIAASLADVTWNAGGTLWVRWTDTNDGGNDGMYALDDFSITANSEPAPPDETTPALAGFSPEHDATGVSVNSKLVLTFDEPVVADAAGTITIINNTAGTSTEISATDTDRVSISSGTVMINYTLAPESHYSVAVKAGSFKDAAGNLIAELSASNWAFTTQEATVPMADTYTESFDACSPNGSATLSGNWMHYSVSGDETWACSQFGHEGSSGVQMNGYNGGAKTNEDWLISPAYNLTGFALPVMSVNYITKYGGPGLQVRVSTDYSGSGDPSVATWDHLLTLDSDNTDTWKLLQNINLTSYKSERTHIAFVYTSNGSDGAARWTLDNFKVENASSILSVSEINFNFGNIAVGAASELQEFTFSAIGYEQGIVLTVPAGFELSKDKITFAQSLTYTSEEASVNNAVFVRFKPASSAVYAGGVSFTSGDVLNKEKGQLQGSSVDYSTTLEIATWNLEWFGSTSNGPSNEEQQYANAKKVITELNADIIAVQEIVDVNLIKQLAQELGYKYEDMDTEWLFSNSQRTGVLYKPEILTVRKEKTLLSKLYADVKAGRATLPDYPASSSTFWASGRLPYLVQFEANINGVRQYINIVNIHAKANSGDDITQYNRRKYDVQVLKDTLDAQYGNTNLVMLGDFNDDVDESVVAGAGASSYSMYVQDTNYKALTLELSQTGAYNLVGSYQSFLDHIVISKNFVDEYIANSIAIRKDFLSSIDNYGTTTSDHLPVMARFQLVTSDPEPELPTGIADATKGQFSVYPNPAQSFVRLSLPDRVRGFQQIKLVTYGIDGRVVLSATGSLEEVQQALNAEVATLKQGMYFLKIEAGKEVFVSRLLKK